MRIFKRLMAKVVGTPKPKRLRYKYEVADGVFVNSIFPDFEFDMPMPERGRFARKPEAAPVDASEAHHTGSA